MIPEPSRIEIERPQELLDCNGCIIQDGWARRPVWHFDRKLVCHPLVNIKEWDRYLITDDAGKWLIITIANQIGKKAVHSITYVDFESRSVFNLKKKHGAGEKSILPQSTTTDYESGFSCSEMRTAFIRRGDVSNIMLCAPYFDIQGFGKGITARFILDHNPDVETYVTAHALSRSRKSFLLNGVSTCIPVHGILRRGDQTDEIVQSNVHAAFDWGRGKFTTKPMFKAIFNSGTFGLCMTDTSSCALFADGRIHIVDDVSIEFSEKGFSVRSKDGRLEISLENGICRQDSSALQVFGSIQGTASFGKGREVRFDNVPGVSWRIQSRK